MKKENIILKAGDKVYYTTCSGKNGSLIIDGFDGDTVKYFEKCGGSKITKIERTIYEAPKEILDKEEKEYLEAVIRPFKNETKYIDKTGDIDNKSEWLRLYVGHIWYAMPLFEKDTMYKGMELNKEYTLAELGLFEGE